MMRWFDKIGYFDDDDDIDEEGDENDDDDFNDKGDDDDDDHEEKEKDRWPGEPILTVWPESGVSLDVR